MLVEISKEQYINLVKLAYLGDWIINSNRKTPIEEFRQIQSFLTSLAPSFESEELIDEDKDTGEFIPSIEIEEELSDYISQYDAGITWDFLITSLAKRDLLKNYGNESLLAMPKEEYISKLYNAMNYYIKEFSQNGIDRLVIDEGAGKSRIITNL